MLVISTIGPSRDPIERAVWEAGTEFESRAQMDNQPNYTHLKLDL
jgi:hypothetical protein